MIKTYVIFCKNWLFSNNQKRRSASSIIYSIIETAKENGLNPFAYFTICLKNCHTWILGIKTP
ncbi:transposase domain-containing protein [Fictibacillus gelatini]|uniref:transposase domain-containing protein n=1 Tax=Fictibacillus gelatini TaxID=225985 RepID=UPI001377EFE9|nr:transposase domain-containing protein [Fictibacillus gelatini]